VAGKGGDGALAVRTGDREDRLARCVPREQLDVAEHRQALRQRFADDFFLQRKPWTHANGVDAVEQCRREGAAVQLAGEVLLARRLAPAVGDAHLAAFALDPAGHRQPGVA
jgi:hypothetical protein